MKTINYFFLLIGFLFGCQKLVSVGEPVNQLTSDVVFTSDKSASSAMAGLYSKIMQSNLLFGSDAMTVFPGLSSDELVNTTSGNYDEFSKNALSPSNTVIQNNIWAAAYNYIYQVNAVVEGLNRSTHVSLAVKQQLRGEAKFMRAFCYFYLVNLFGDVPLITETSFEKNATIGRTPKSEVYTQMLSDLKEAKSAMTEAYPTGERVRPNKWAAAALLARVYLYIGNYADAEAEASEVISSGMYSLETDVSQVFLKESQETIWALAPVQPNYNTWEGNIFVPATNTVPQFYLDSNLLAKFSVNDQRKVQWTGSVTIGGTTYVFPLKYKIKTATAISENYVVLRLAEMCLIRSEARIVKGDFNGAKDDLNHIRVRAGLGNTVAVGTEALLTECATERQIEFFAEWGHRWFDLKRTQKADEILQSRKGANWQATDKLYPVPTIEIQRNPALEQNPGY